MTKQKSTKRALLTSALALLVCVSMLIGSTFAWFTDSVTSSGNIIKSGTLDVTMEWKDATTTGAQKTYKDASQGAIFNYDKWEPGYVEAKNIKIGNNGTLALKYALNILANGEVSILADVIDVYFAEGEYTLESRDLTKLTNVGTLADILKKMPSNTSGDLLAGETDTVTIALKMQESADNKYQGLSIGSEFAIQLLATQLAYESDSFGNDYDKGVEVNNKTLKDALSANDKTIVVSLTENVTYDVAAWAANGMGGADTETIIINGNGYTITFNQTDSDWNNVVTNGAKLVINNANITNAGHNDGPWNRHDINFACDVELNNVVSDKALAFKADATLNNVTIDDANTSDTYAIWIQPNGQTVTLNGCIIDMNDCTDGRGIKIDEQYVSTPAKVSLNVSDTIFKTEEKAAIMVKSAAGADIVLNNVDIYGVSADPFNAVWVDADAAAYADLVTVNGASMIVEGSANAPKANSVAADTTVTMDSVITAGDQTVINNEGTIDLSGTPNLNGGDVVVNGGTVVTTSANYTGLQHAGEVTYNNVTFDGSTFLYGDKVVFNNCTFNLTTNYVWTYGAKEVEFNNCTFNTNGKAILVYKEAGTFSGVVTINSCDFNATASGFAGAIPTQPCAAVEIDSSLINGTYTVNFIGENDVDEDFSGLVRIKSGSEKNNVTINGATPVILP